MSADIRKVTFDGGTAEYNANMTMGALSSLMQATETGNLEEIMTAMAQFVTVWSFDGDPSELKAWEALGRKEFGALIEAVTGDMSDLGEE